MFNMNDIKNIQNIIAKMRTIGRYTNRNNFKLSNLTPELTQLKQIDIRNIEFVESLQIVLSQNRGFCYDQTFLAKKYFDFLNIENHIFYSCTNNIQKLNNQYVYKKNVISHVFIIYKQTKYKWLQWSWFANINNKWQYDTLDEILNAYKLMAQKSWHMPIILTNIDNMTPKKSRLQFLNAALNRQFIYG